MTGDPGKTPDPYWKGAGPQTSNHTHPFEEIKMNFLLWTFQLISLSGLRPFQGRSFCLLGFKLDVCGGTAFTLTYLPPKYPKFVCF